MENFYGIWNVVTTLFCRLYNNNYEWNMILMKMICKCEEINEKQGKPIALSLWD